MTLELIHEFDMPAEIQLRDLPSETPPVVLLSDQHWFYHCADLIAKEAAAIYDQSDYAQRSAGTGRVAYITFATPDYDLGVRVLIRSIRKVSSIPIIVLLTSPWKLQSEARDVFGLVVPGIRRYDVKRARQEFGATYTKLWSFAFTTFDRVVFIDSDFLVLGDLDALWTGHQFKVCRDSVETAKLDRFNSGLLAFTPKKEYLDRIATEGPSALSEDGGDQGLLNSLFSNDVKYIESDYNLTKHYWYFRPPEIDCDRIRCLHFIVKKPWDLWYHEITDSFTVDLEDRWTRFLTRQELLDLVSHWRRRQFIAERPRFDLTRKNKSSREDRRKKRMTAAVWIAAGGLPPLAFFLGRLLAG